MTSESEIPHKVPSVVTGYTINDKNKTESLERTNMDDNVPGDLDSAIIRVTNSDVLKTTTNSQSNTIREILPVNHPKSIPTHAITSVESIPDLIKKLAELREAEIITEQEFSTKKAELLKRI